jgi:uncharacterized protein YfaS (alpha-2-macroglobulin family)
MLPEIQNSNNTSTGKNKGSNPRQMEKIITVVGLMIIAGLIIYTVAVKGDIGKHFLAPGEKGVSIVSFIPTGEVENTTNITVEFTHNMVEDQEVQVELEPDSNLINFNPDIPGRFKWISTHKLRFFPTADLKPATSYKAIVNPDIATLQNRSISGNRIYEFNTPPLRVSHEHGEFIYEGFPNVLTFIQWEIEFNYAIAPAKLKSYLEIYYNLNDEKVSLDYTIQPAAPSNTFTVKTGSIDPGIKAESIKFMISEGLKPEGGDLGLQSDFFSSLKIEPDLKVERVTFTSNVESSSLIIEFSAPVDPQEAKKYISVDPSIEFKTQQDGRKIILQGDFKIEKWYTVNINKGLTGINAKQLTRNFSQRVKIGDLPKSVEFMNKGIYLPKTGSKNIAVDTMNVEKVVVEVNKIYRNNLVYALYNTHNNGYEYYDYYDYYDYGEESNPSTRLGKRVSREEEELDYVKNELVSTPVDIGKFNDSGKKGLFNVTVRDFDDMWVSDSMFLLITDLGIVANMSEDTLSVWVCSLDNLNPISGVDINLISGNNQVIATAKTNRDGIAVIDEIQAKVEDEKFEPYIITAVYNDDMSFLKFDDCQLPTASFDVNGRPFIKSGYEAFLYADRDIFRPNDKANFAAIVRAANVSEPESFPLKLEILDPMNRTFATDLRTIEKGGVIEFNVDIPDYAMTGGYLARLLAAEDEIGRMEFNVEDFIPDKTKIVLTTDKKSYNKGENVKISLKGEYLFGPPASGLEVDTKLTIKSNPFTHAKWKGYTFGDEDRKFDATDIDLGSNLLDDNGKFEFQTKIPDNFSPPSALKGIFAATIKEQGGRAVSSFTTVDIHPYPVYIGLKAKNEGYVDVGKKFETECVVLNPNGEKAKGKSLKVDIFKIVYNTIRQRDYNGRFEYISVRNDELETSFKFNPDTAKTISFTPGDYGRYKILVSDEQNNSSSAIYFYASGWGYAPWSMESPGEIELQVEKERYNPGETAKVLVKSPFPGKMLLTVQQDKVHYFKVIDIKENTATVEIPVSENYKPNVYVTATVIKSLNDFDGKSPQRAFGIAPLFVNTSKHKLDIEITSAGEIRPGSQLDVGINIKNKKGSTYLTLAAVDEGILQLTEYATPDPFDFFYGKKRFVSDCYDIFSLVLPELDKFKKKPSGDFYADVRKKHLSPVGIKRVEPVSLWSGIVKTDNNGKANVKMKMPQFDGKLRLMVVASNGSETGSGSKNIFVRDKIVLTHSLPRFITGNDEFYIPVSVYNGTGKDGSFIVNLDASGPVEILDGPSKTVKVSNQKQGSTSFKIKVKNGIGKSTFNLKASGNGEKTQATTNVPVRPASPVITKTQSHVISDGKPLDVTLPGEFIKDTDKVKIVISSFPEVKFTKSLQYLLEYPHGCLEQTTSSVFPLLYFNNLAKAAEPELFEANSASYFIDEGISKIISMQQDYGAFSYWPQTYYINHWTSVYAAHFLVEARKAGYQVPDSVYNNVISWLKSYSRQYFDYSNSRYNYSYHMRSQVYACYVLALAGDPPKSSIDYFRDNKLKELPVSSLYQIAFCYYKMGNQKMANELLPSDIQPVEVERETGNSLASSVRDNAIMLDVLAEINPDSPGIPVLIKSLEDSIVLGRWGTTQENAFVLLAMGKALKKQEKANYKGKILVDGKPYKEFTQTGINIKDEHFAGRKLSVSIKGTGNCYLYWQVYGIPDKNNFDEYDKGISVTRKYLDINGNPIDYKNIKQGDLIIGKVTAKALNKTLENVIIDDMLPSGLEIENPRLSSRAQITWLEEKSNESDYMDMRDDRLLLYTYLPSRQEKIFYYALRAVTKGDFLLPPVSAECMYDPTFTSVQSSGSIKVVN